MSQLLRPSSAERWVHCPGSAVIEPMLPRGESRPEASEGTRLHDITAETLQQGWDRDTVHMIHGLDRDDLSAVMFVVEHVRQLSDAGTGAIEKRLPFSGVTGEEGATCRPDAYFFHGEILHVIDWKYGKGVAVDAKKNLELICFALAILDHYTQLADEPLNVEHIVLTVLQPRLQGKRNNVSQWTMTPGELEDHEMVIRDHAELAESWIDSVRDKGVRDAIRAVDEEAGLLVPSDIACRFCPLKSQALCPALDQMVEEVVGEPVEEVVGEPADGGASLLAEKYERLGLIRSWASSIEAAFLQELKAAGGEADGYKLVAGRSGTRKWRDPDVVANLCRSSFQLPKKLIFEERLLSPAKMEKLEEITPKRWAKLNQQVMKANPKPVIVPATDDRPVYTGAADSTEFPEAE